MRTLLWPLREPLRLSQVSSRGERFPKRSEARRQAPSQDVLQKARREHQGVRPRLRFSGNCGRGRLFFFCRLCFLERVFPPPTGFSSLALSPAEAAASFFEEGFSPSASPFIFTRTWLISHRVSGAYAHVDNRSVGRGRNFNGGLVRFHFKQGLLERDPVSGHNENLYYLSGFDSFSKFWKPEFYQLTFLITKPRGSACPG